MRACFFPFSVYHCVSSMRLFCFARLTLNLVVSVHYHRIKMSNRRATQRCNVSAFFYAKICSLLARRRSSQPVQRVYWPENVRDWLGRWRPTCVMRHARGQKLQSFRRKWPFYIYMDLYSMPLSHHILVCTSSDFQPQRRSEANFICTLSHIAHP
jgi:hypothetical protein